MMNLGRLLRPRRIEDQAVEIGDAAHRPAHGAPGITASVGIADICLTSR